MTCCGGAVSEHELVLDSAGDGDDMIPDRPIPSIPRTGNLVLASNKVAEIQAPAEVRSKITWKPAVDIFFDKKDSTVALLMDLPGFTKDDVNVEVGEGQLYISGPRSKNELREKYGANLVLSAHERPTGFFFRAFQLAPNAVEDSVQAVMTNGILEVKLSCIQTHEMKKVEIGLPGAASGEKAAKK
ncbi:heat shock protein HSP20 [Besnoitia besnoiti]|uniref:Heat shock protein HSP20 n=1 Tax=Besnoitia besnoiti TaxID=94643 RepID=A0A2A9MQI8_BESBE|nr:heat shock protein HSP20 [Besnoitia besnoiti]PFH38533.1 heat shock protein HSP20 [Besnoitia besnoiti]